EDVFSKILLDVVTKYKEFLKNELVQVTTEKVVAYTLPEIVSVSSETYEEVSEMEKYYYDKCYLEKKRSNPERAFEEYIQRKAHSIQYWVKNGDSGKDN